jgi:hypothetical protein
MKICYIDFWREIEGVPFKIEDIKNKNCYTSNRNLVNIDKGVGLFHIENLEKILGKKLVLSSPSDCDFLVCSIFGDEKYKYPSKKKIYLIYEPKDQDNRIRGNVMYFSSNLNLNSNFYLPLYICYYGFDIYSLKRKGISREEFNKKRNCLSIISNSRGIQRNNILNYFMVYAEIDNYGKLFKNKSDPRIESSCWFDPVLIDCISQYKFMICFENEVKCGYHTEKIMNGFRSGVVPIYFGDPNCMQIFNPSSYININLLGIENSKDLFLKLLGDYEAYNEMLTASIFSEFGILNSEEYKNYKDENYFNKTLKNFIEN